jgi:hypothetical protein
MAPIMDQRDISRLTAASICIDTDSFFALPGFLN